MPAKFEKEIVPPLGAFDGFDPKVLYQMVPVGEERAMAIVTDADECTAIVDPPGVAKMQKFVFTKPLLEVPRELRARITPQNRFVFRIFGEKTGNTTIFLVDRQGKSFATLLVSVKSRISKTVSLCRLADMKRNCPWPANGLPSILADASRTFLQQANIELKQHKTVFEVPVAANLGNPLFLDRGTGRNQILTATPLDAFGANFLVYFTWDLRSVTGEIVGQNFGIDCYAEFETDPNEQRLTTAHEIGHGLGLNHTGAKTLMAGDGNSRSSLLQQFEIDTINKTDEAP
jgi:hypothetical protein